MYAMMRSGWERLSSVEDHARSYFIGISYLSRCEGDLLEKPRVLHGYCDDRGCTNHVSLSDVFEISHGTA